MDLDIEQPKKFTSLNHYEIGDWLSTQMRRNDARIMSSVNVVQDSPVSCVYSFSSSLGTLYYKVSHSIFSHESSLMSYLSSHWSDLLPELVAIDTDRNGILMKDAGSSMHEYCKSRGGVVDIFQEVIKAYAQLQKESVNYVSEIIEAGCPQLIPEQMTEKFQWLLKTKAASALPKDIRVGLEKKIPLVHEQSSRLASSSIPCALHHDDFSHNNIFFNFSEKVRFIDWAEVYITFPFFTLHILFRVARNIYKLPDDDIMKLQSLYLKQWREYAPEKKLADEISISFHLARLCRAFSWVNMAEAHETYLDHARYSLAFFYHYPAEDIAEW